MSHITSGREMNNQTKVKVEGVCDQADMERERERLTAMVVVGEDGVDSLEARFEGEDFGG